jgi:anaerobic ribonucleoside-triphosphate reductase
MTKIKKKAKVNPNVCPLCGEVYWMAGKKKLCIICNEHEIKLISRDMLRRNKKKIELGMVRTL